MCWSRFYTPFTLNELSSHVVGHYSSCDIKRITESKATREENSSNGLKLEKMCEKEKEKNIWNEQTYDGLTRVKQLNVMLIRLRSFETSSSFSK